MYRIYLFCGLLFPLGLLAQVNSGSIQYEERLNLRKRIEVQEPELAKMLPPFQTSEKTLVFQANQTRYQATVKTNGEESYETEGGEIRMKLRVQQAEDILFRDLAEGRSVEQREFMGKVFLIEDSIQPHRWRIGTGQRVVAGYQCQEAILEGGEEPVVAYFSPQIPVQSGPRGFGQLPGMILAMDIGEGDLLIEATSVQVEGVDPSTLTPPRKGKAVTRAEYDAIVAAKTKELQETHGSGGTVIRIFDDQD